MEYIQKCMIIIIMIEIKIYRIDTKMYDNYNNDRKKDFFF